MKLFRKSGIIAFISFAVLSSVFGFFFLDPLAKAAAMNFGERIFKAKVEIDKFDIQALKGKVILEGIAVADRNNPMINLFEAKNADFDLMTSQLPGGNIIIDAVSVEGMTTGGARKTSGQLSEARLKAIEKKDAKLAAKAEFAHGLGVKAFERAKEQAGVKLPVAGLEDIGEKFKSAENLNIAAKESLESYKLIGETGGKITQKKDELLNSIKAVEIDKKAAEMKKAAESLKGIKVASVEDIPAAKAKLDELNRVYAELQQAKKQLEGVKLQAESFYAFSASSLNEINAAKERDINNAMAMMNINMLNPSEIEKAIIGPVWYSRIRNVLDTARLANRYIPAKKKKKYAQIKRMHGTDIIFSGRQYPNFWIKKIVLNGGSSDNGGLGISGMIKDLTGEQDITGLPISIKLNGVRGNQRVTVDGVIDHRDAVKDTITAVLSGIPAKYTAGLGNVSMASDEMRSKVELVNTDDFISIKGGAEIGRPVFSAGNTSDLTYQALSSIDGIAVDFTLKNGADGANIEINSDIKDRLSKAAAKLYGKKAEELKARLGARVEETVKSEKDKLLKQAQGNKDELAKVTGSYASSLKGTEAEIEKVKAEINNKISALQKKGTENLLKGIFK
ncbi:MAG TPA: TIGR03545 family protein [Candidatus Goldiibacteriota bacterium]|nr:TIGR03545 family protein [Candidatus Goldiibacteriota bacterium]HRQ43747.1 TIGR03545 family protein [Candidatus Goldiibacteriota bacterium]